MQFLMGMIAASINDRRRKLDYVQAGPRRSLVAVTLAGLVLGPFLGCSGNQVPGVAGKGGNSPSAPSGGGQTGKGGASGSGGTTSSGGSSTGGENSGGDTGGGGVTSSGDSSAAQQGGSGGVGGGSASSGGATGKGGDSGTSDASVSDRYVVAMVQSDKGNASDLTVDDVAQMVSSAVSQAGGLDFIHFGQTVVLKPNLLTAYKDGMRQAADQTVNGISTDWRVVKAVADLVRAKVGSDGKILVMEGSVTSTATAYSVLGYTKDNISAVDEFIAVEGSSCTDRSTTGLVQRPGKSGKQYWVNQRYAEADVVISLPVMKTHLVAGITGGVKNLGIGMTPIGQYATPSDGGMSRMSNDCTRGQTAADIDHSSPETLGAFIRDYYSVRPADFVVMDALQGLEHGPHPIWDSPPGDGGGSYSYESSKKNMRLILAGQNAVAVDTIETLVMKCDPQKVPHLTKLAADGLGTTDTTKITVVGKRVDEVSKPFACKLTDICPGT